MSAYSLSEAYSEARHGNAIRLNHDAFKARVNAVPIEFAGRTVLDVACGHENPFFAERLRLAKNVIGLDGNQQEVERNRFLHERYIGDIHAMPLPDKSVDLVISVDTIEHSVSPDQFLKECNRVLKRGGEAVFTTPNLLGYKNLFARFCGKQIFNLTWKVFHNRRLEYDTCYRCNTAGTFRRKAAQAGFRVDEIHYVPEISWFFSRSATAFTLAHGYNLMTGALRLERLWGYMVVKVVKV